MNPFKANLANAFLENPISASDTTATLSSGYAATLPLPPFFSTMTPQGQLSTFGNSEIILVTEVNGDTLTIIRAQKGTSAKSFQKGAIVSNGIYAESTIAIGDIVMTLNAAPSAGRLFMDGGTYTKANYPLLYKHVQNNPAYGTTGGTAGSETFTLTDMRQRMPFGKSQNSPFTALAATGGTTQEILTIAQMPRHRHTMDRGRWYSADSSFGTSWSIYNQMTTTTAQGESIDTESANRRVIGYSGGDQPHNNMPPYLIVNFEIIAG